MGTHGKVPLSGLRPSLATSGSQANASRVSRAKRRVGQDLGEAGFREHALSGAIDGVEDVLEASHVLRLLAWKLRKKVVSP